MDANPGDGVAEDAAGDTSLRAAIMEANALVGADSIFLGADTYTLTAGLGDDQGDLDIRDDLTIVGISPSVSVINGGNSTSVLNVHDDAAITVSLSNLMILDGQTAAVGEEQGGGLYIEGAINTPDVFLDNVWFSGNTATFSIGHGGAIHNEGNLTITNALIEGNTADEGGGVWNATGGVLFMKNVTLSGNSATNGDGGGLFNEGGDVTLRHVTVTGNSASGLAGGVIHDGGAITTNIGNSIIAGNSALGGSPDVTNKTGNITSAGGNIVEDATGTESDFGPGEIGIDPLLGGLTNNGGDLLTHAPAAPEAIDNAIRALSSTTDQRGFLRGDGSPDVGAYEASATAGGTATYLDQFNTAASFAGDNGALPWTNDWQEIGETSGAGAGDVRVADNFFGDGGGNVELIVKTNKGVWREADLYGATAATLSFDYALVGLEADDHLVVYAQVGGGIGVDNIAAAPGTGTWYEIARYSGPADDAAYLSDSVDLSAYIGCDTRIMFLADGAFNGNDKLFVDNVQIELSTSTPVTTALSPVKDTYISNDNQTTNYGSDTVVRLDESGGSAQGDGRVLLQFDLSAIPAGATITSATLQVEATGKTGTIPASSVIDVYEVTEAWDEGAGGTNNNSTWNERQTGTAWTSGPGGSFDGTALASLEVSGLGGHTWDVTDLVQDWQSGAKSNNGLMLGSGDTGTVVFDYVSREGAMPPQLVISYTTAAVTNDAPTLASFVGPVTAGDEDSEIEVTFGHLAVQGDEADADGTVDGFVVKSVTSGTLKIGADAGSAAPWAAGSNDTLNATTNAYWTPEPDANGDLDAFEVVALDDDGAESATPVTVQVTVNSINDAPTVVGPTPVFINEIHYDNVGVDAGEAIEIAGVAGNDLSGWQLVLYNGLDGTVYDTVNVTGTIPNQADNFGTLVFNFPENGIQNATGDPDGIALVDPTGAVVQFLSYEGAFTATDGPANGMGSTDIGVAESNASTPAGNSLQLTGPGPAFTWAAAAANTFGAINTGQDFAAIAAASNQTIDENSSLVFSSGNGNAIVVDDVDAALGAALDPVSVQLDVSNGTLTLGSTTGLGPIAGNGTGTVVFTGTIAELNAALDGLTYQPDPGYNGSDSLSILVDDQGNAGSGGNQSSVGNVFITINPVSAVPTIGNNALSISQGGAILLDSSVLSASDADDPDGDLVFQVSNVSHGWFAYTVDTSTAITSFTQQEVTDGNVVFLHDGGELAPAYQVSVTDGTNTAAAAPAIVTFSDTSDGVLWLSTTGDENASNGVPGLDTSGWDQGDILQLAGPDLSLGEGATDGTFSIAFDISDFAVGANINGMHFVSSNVTIGSTNAVTLQAGDLLLTTENDETLVSNGAAPESDLDVLKEDIFYFRPDKLGDYSTGNFYRLLGDVFQDGQEINALTLVEQDVWLGDVQLNKGDLLAGQGRRHLAPADGHD